MVLLKKRYKSVSYIIYTNGFLYLSHAVVMSVQLQPFFSTETTSTTSCTNKNVLYWPDSIRNCFSWRTNALVPRKQPIKDVSLHALITRNLLQFKLRNMTNVACFHGQHSSFCLPLQLH